MDFRATQRIVFWAIAVVLVVGVAILEFQSFTDERLNDVGRFTVAPTRPVIYSNGPYGLYGIGTMNGVPQSLPTINGKSYNVVYYRTGIFNVFEHIYYFVPVQALEALPSRPCRNKAGTGNNLLTTRTCVDLQTITGAQRVAAVYDKTDLRRCGSKPFTKS
jgi:hypothetical protein